jgi:endonuclease-3
MLKAERANFVGKTLADMYPLPPIPLKHSSPFTLLISVLLSAQCTDARVNMVTPNLFALADTPQKMAGLSVAQVYETIRSCGLAPGKSRAIVSLSNILCNEYDAQVPEDMHALEQLPGVGHKTASVVMCQAYNQPALPVDTHIHRLARRWGLSNGTSVVRTERDLKSLFPREQWCALHLRMIYYGREHCTARGCLGLSCRICTTCYPRRKKPV